MMGPIAPGEATVTYGWDLAGRMVRASDTSAAVTAPSTTASYRTTTAYDAMNRPGAVSWSPAAAQTAPAASTVRFTHSYDPTNRRTGQTATDNSWWSYPSNPSTTTIGYTANNLNQYTTVSTVHPSYDANGNLTDDGVFTYGYDAESRLASVKQGATTVATYTWDAQGRRKSKTAGGASTVFVTDADNREVLEYDGSAGTVQRWYAFGQGPDDVLNQMNVAAGTRETMIPDIQGSIIGTLASGGALTKIGYQPFGENPTLTSGTFRWTGRRFDPETAGSPAQPSGLYYYRARMYSPTWGRFPQPDPIGYTGGSNLYAYTDNDPLNLTDPSGTFCIPCGFALGGAVVGLSVQALHDYETGHFSSLGNYAGAATAGALGGLSLLAGGGFGTVVAYGIGAAAAGNSVQQLTDLATGAQHAYNVTSTVSAIVAGGATAAILKPFSGVIASQYGPISQGLITKYLNGTIAQATPRTVAKMVGTEFLEENAIPAAVIGDALNNLASQSLPSVSIGGFNPVLGGGAVTNPPK